MTQKETLESFSDTLPSLLPAMTLGTDRPKTVGELSVQQGQEEEKEKDDEDFPVTAAVGTQEGPGQEAAVDEQGLEDEAAASQYKQTIRPTSTYSSMKQMTRGPGRRLVEYFVVVSSLPTKKDSSAVSLSPNVSFESQFDEIPRNVSIEYDVEDEFNFEPVITARYPLEDHHGNPLHQSVACFCHPCGIIQLKSKPCMPKVSTVYCSRLG
jgi:hypothetical protein